MKTKLQKKEKHISLYTNKGWVKKIKNFYQYLMRTPETE
jgi:hypothetical protein